MTLVFLPFSSCEHDETKNERRSTEKESERHRNLKWSHINYVRERRGLLELGAWVTGSRRCIYIIYICWFICSLSDFMKCSTLTSHRYRIIYSAGVLFSRKWEIGDESESVPILMLPKSRSLKMKGFTFFSRTPAPKQKLERKTLFSETWIYHHWDACTHFTGRNRKRFLQHKTEYVAK